MQLNSVVLPAPFEPRTARRSPGRECLELFGMHETGIQAETMGN